MNFGFNYEAATEAAREAAAEEGGEYEYDGDAEPDQDNFMYFETPSGAQHASSSSNRQGRKKTKKRSRHYQPYEDGEGEEAGGKVVKSKPVYDFVDMETLRRRNRIRSARLRIKKPESFSDEMDSEPSSAGGLGGGGGGGGSAQSANREHSEVMAAAVAEHEMYESSCSEDEEVLAYELKHYDIVLNSGRNFSRPHCNSNDRSGLRGSGHDDIPINARLFEESLGGTSAAAASSEAYGAVHGDDWSEDSAIPAQETVQSKRQRVAEMRDHLHREKTRRGVVAEQCFKCMYGNERYDSVYAEPLAQLCKLMEQEIGRRDLRAVSRTVHLYFKNAIYLPMLKAGRYVPMWRTRSIYEHLTEHETEPRVQLYRQIKTLNTLQSVLIDKQTGEVKVNVPVVRALVDIIKTSNQLQSVDPKKMLFYNDKASIDLAAAGANSNTQKQAVRGRFVLKPLPPPSSADHRL